MEREQELKNCTTIKTILMLIVVLYHSMKIFSGGWGPYEPVQEAPLLGYISDWLNSFHVYTFVLISGYIFCYIKDERNGYQKYLPFVWNKIRRLLVPYVFIAAVWVAPTYAYYWGSEKIVSKYLLGTEPSQLWFLLMLILGIHNFLETL